MKTFNGVEFDDYETNEDGTQWSQLCSKCANKHTFDGATLDDAGSGICGVYGCWNEADVYIDFKQEHPKYGEWFYLKRDDELLRKINWIGRSTFEWNYGWGFIEDLNPNPDYPDKSKVKWIHSH